MSLILFIILDPLVTFKNHDLAKREQGIVNSVLSDAINKDRVKTDASQSNKNSNKLISEK